jgi:single-strand DNA-binding protein
VEAISRDVCELFEVVTDTVRFLESSGAGNREEGTGAYSSGSGNGGDSRHGGSREQQDPFIADGKPIDISDDDLPF